ncbi:MAG: hypothetical protein F6K22_09025 [Okeania sp. SIO2F4]|nr:hypothetical protein [Okeania sp. SIO2F4]
MQLVNPLYHPLAILIGGITLIIGVRFTGLPSIIMLPTAAIISTAGATLLNTSESESVQLKNPALVKEIESVKQQANLLAEKANNLRQEAGKLLTGTPEMELLGFIQYACDRSYELPTKIDKMVRRLQGDDSLLSTSELQRQLNEVEAKLSSSRGIAREQLTKLATSLQRNIELANQGQDARQAQVISLSTMIQESAGVLQQMQNKLRMTDLSNYQQQQELQALSQELRSFQENIDFLIYQ